MPALDPVSGRPSSDAEDFPPTHWSLVLSAGQPGSPQAEEALDQLCDRYWYPLYAFVRRRGHSPEEAEDLIQEYFARLLGKQLLCGLKREGGKFRSYLLTALKCFLANEWHREHAQKRGGGKPRVYALLTEHPPFRGATPAETIRQVMEEEPRRPGASNRAVDKDLETICLKCLEKQPQRRYESAVALAEDWERGLRMSRFKRVL